MQVAFLGFGLIGGSIARAVRAPHPGERRGRWHGLVAVRRRAGRALRRRRHRRRRGRRQSDALVGADLVVLAGPATDCLDADRRPGRAAGARRCRPTAIVTDVASTKGRHRRTGAIAPACGSSAAIRWPVARRAATRPPTADLFAGRPWVLVPASPASTADVGRRDRPRPGLRRASGGDGCGGPRRRRRRHQPSAAGRRGRAGRSRRRALRRRTPDLADGCRARRERLARHDPARARATRRWARRSPPRTRPAIAARLQALRAVLDDWLAELEPPTVRTKPGFATGSRPRADRLLDETP